MITFGHPEYLIWGLAALLFLFLLLCLYAIRRARVLKKAPSLKGVAFGGGAESTRNILLIVSFLCAFAIALEPSRDSIRDVPLVEGLEIIAMVDCSKSMLAPAVRDDPSSRMSVVGTALDRIFRALDKDRWGLGCFAGMLIGTPVLTVDYERILRPRLLQMQDPFYISSVGSGTDFNAALEGCHKGFRHAGSKVKKVCLIFSDGEPQGDQKEMDQRLNNTVALFQGEIAEHGWDVVLYLVGVGNPAEAFRIPKYTPEGNIEGYEKDKQENEVLTQPDQQFLRSIAARFGGHYRHLTHGEDISFVIAQIAQEERRVIGKKKETAREDLSYPLAITMLLSLLAFINFPRRVRLTRR